MFVVLRADRKLLVSLWSSIEFDGPLLKFNVFKTERSAVVLKTRLMPIYIN